MQLIWEPDVVAEWLECRAYCAGDQESDSQTSRAIDVQN